MVTVYMVQENTQVLIYLVVSSSHGCVFCKFVNYTPFWLSLDKHWCAMDTAVRSELG